MESIPLFVWLCILCTASIIYAAINLKTVVPYWKHRRLQFLAVRRPTLLLMYAVLVSFVLCAVIPNIAVCIYYRSLSSLNERYKYWSQSHYFLVFQSIYHSIFGVFINLIAVRVWLLFFDYHFSQATVDRIWRNVINPSDNNFFLNYKSTLGRLRFLLKLLFAMWLFTASVIVVFIIATAASPSVAAGEFLFFGLRILFALPACIFVVYLCHKMKHIDDEFLIRKEMQYLAYLVSLLVVLTVCDFILLLFLEHGIQLHRYEVVGYSLDVLFVCSTSFVQTNFVLRQYIRKQERRKLAEIDNELAKQMPMIDVLRNQRAFEVFMRHCVNELSVESLLFLVEVGQYKATLTSYKAPDALTQFASLDVATVNLQQLLLDNRKQTITHWNADDETPAPKDSRASSWKFSTLPSDAEISAGQVQRRSDPLFRQFQQSILFRKWLPINLALRPHRQSLNHSLLTTESHKTMKDLRIVITDPRLDLSAAGMDGNENENENGAEPELVLERAWTDRDADESKTIGAHTALPPSPRMLSIASGDLRTISLSDRTRSPSSPRLELPKSQPSNPQQKTITAEWIKELSRYIFEKYIEPDSELCINIPSATRSFLVDFFALSDDAAFQYIVRHSRGLGPQCESLPAAIDEQLLINTYMHHIFDLAWEDVWRLLRNNSFKRLAVTDTFEKLVNDKQRATETGRLSVQTPQMHPGRKMTTTTPPSGDIIFIESAADVRASVKL